jgi:hypothetical protein
MSSHGSTTGLLLIAQDSNQISHCSGNPPYSNRVGISNRFESHKNLYPIRIVQGSITDSNRARIYVSDSNRVGIYLRFELHRNLSDACYGCHLMMMMNIGSFLGSDFRENGVREIGRN